MTYGQWGTLSVNFYVNPTNLDVSESAATSALQTGMNVWNTQSGTGFRFGYAGRVSDTTTGYDNRNVILFRNQSNGSTIASTYTWASNGVLVDADIVFWDGGFQFFTGSSGCTGGAYIEDIASHELGHALGLDHSSVTDATMYPAYASCTTDWRTLSSDDIAGAQALYANGAGTADAPPTVTISDADKRRQRLDGDGRRVFRIGHRWQGRQHLEQAGLELEPRRPDRHRSVVLEDIDRGQPHGERDGHR